MNKEIGIKKLVLLSTIIFLAAGCNQNKPIVAEPAGYDVTVAEIAGHKINIQIAKTDALRELGLGNRDFLPENDGMLFTFPVPGKYGFWMKGMRFGLDFIWISQGKVVQIIPNVPAEPGTADIALKIYSPDFTVDSVLEVNAGWVEKNNIKAGDSVEIQSNR